MLESIDLNLVSMKEAIISASKNIDLEVIDFLILLENEKELNKNEDNELFALAQVELELTQVEQILKLELEKLEETKNRLSIVQNEGSAMEISYSNLQQIYDIGTYCKDKVRLTSKELKVLNDPSQVFKTTARKPFDGSKLTDAAQNLAISIRFVNSGLRDATMCHNVSLIELKREGRKHLNDIKNNFCRKLLELMPTFMTDFLRNSVIINSNDFIIKVKPTNPQDFIRYGIRLSSTKCPSNTVRRLGTFQVCSTLMREFEMISAVVSPDVNNNNESWNSQQSFHDILNQHFTPLFKVLYRLDLVTFKSIMMNYYAEDLCKTHIYKPLIKHILKPIKSNLAAHKNRCSLETVSDFSLVHEKIQLQVKLSSIEDASNITPWIAFTTVLTFLIPILESEEKFLKDLFVSGALKGVTDDMNEDHDSDDDSDNSYDDNPSAVDVQFNSDAYIQKELLHVIFDYISKGDKIFDICLKNVRSFSNLGQAETDGVVFVAILVSLENYMTLRSAELSPDGFVSEYLGYLKQYTIDHIEKFINEQLLWISSRIGDPKKGVALVVAKLPAFIYQLVSLVGMTQVTLIENFILNLIERTIEWVNGLGTAYPKYSDLVKITNFR